MSVEVDIERRLGDFRLAVTFAGREGLTALFGRSGAGKTTVINVIAGLLRPDRGRVVIGGRTVVDTGQGIFVPRHRRRIGYVFQESRLFPHMSVRRNLQYGEYLVPRQERYADFDHIVDMLGIGHLLNRRPARLSGGEKQRVSIGRALLASPRLLLMDEPLASLDEQRKEEVLPYLERLRDDVRVPILYVSHAVGEVARLADTMVVLSDGRVAADGPTTEVMGRLDLFPLTGRAEAGAVLDTVVARHDPAYGLSCLKAAAGELWVPHADVPVGTNVRIRVRARDVLIGLRPPEDLSALNVLRGVVAEIGGGDRQIADIRLDCGGQILLARLTRKSIERLGLVPGQAVYAVIKSIAFDRRTMLGKAGGDRSGHAAADAAFREV